MSIRPSFVHRLRSSPKMGCLPCFRRTQKALPIPCYLGDPSLFPGYLLNYKGTRLWDEPSAPTTATESLHDPAQDTLSAAHS